MVSQQQKEQLDWYETNDRCCDNNFDVFSEFRNAELLTGYATLCSALINERDVSPLLLLLHELGDWPVLQPSWNESGYDVNELVAKVNLRGKNALWNKWVSADDRNSDSNIIQVSMIFVFQSFQSIS